MNNWTTIGKYNMDKDKVEPMPKEDIPSLEEVIKKVQYGPGPGFKREDTPFRGGGNKMSRCPECDVQVNTLLLWERTWDGYVISYDPDKANNMKMKSYNDKYVGYVIREFACPNCHAVIFTNQREAMNFLTGGAQ